MKNTRIFTAAAFALALIGSAALVASQPAKALTSPPTYSPRVFNTQQTHYLRFVVNFNSCPLPASAGNCSYKVGSLPYNAFVVRAYQQVYTAFNSTTTDTLAIGTASGGAQLVAAQSVHTQTAGLGLTVVAANLGTVATGDGATQSGGNGGFDVWATLAYTGSSPATAGSAVVIIEYFAPNDGGCYPVPQGSTAVGC
jgi:hypothetical protein